MIKGFDEGLKGMCVGEKRWVLIPSALGYGVKGAGDGLIPPNSTLSTFLASSHPRFPPFRSSYYQDTKEEDRVTNFVSFCTVFEILLEQIKDKAKRGRPLPVVSNNDNLLKLN